MGLLAAILLSIFIVLCVLIIKKWPNTIKKLHDTLLHMPQRILEWIGRCVKRVKHIQERMSKKDTLPLTGRPFAHDDVYEELGKDLDIAFHNSEILNIGIEGERASGKSSLIKTYEKKNTLPVCRYLNISIANCETASGEMRLTQEIVETYLLKHILAYANEGDLPNSKYFSVATDRRKRPVFLIFLITLCIFVCIALLSFEWWEIFVIEERRKRVQGVLVIVLAISITAIVPVILMKYRHKFYLKKFGLEITPLKVEIDSVQKAGIDENTRELIYILKKMRRRISHTVVIEDLELMSPDDCLDIFRKLKNLNRQLNNNLRRHRFFYLGIMRKPIRFIYAYRNIFDNQFVEDKFFDKVIYVPTRLTIDNIGAIIEEKIAEEIKKGRYKRMSKTENMFRFDAGYISKVGVEFLGDFRKLNRFLAKYLRAWEIFCRNLGDEGPLEDDPKRLFSFVLYHEIWPSSIDKFRKRSFSELNCCMKNDFSEIDDSVDRDLLLYLTTQCPEPYRVNELCMRFINFKPMLYSKHYEDYLQAIEADNYEVALDCLSKAICCKPRIKELYMKRAECYEKLENMDQAAEERRKAESIR